MRTVGIVGLGALGVLFGQRLLENGADLVLELPTRFACAPAPDFASGGVALLSALGVATHLSFGCEASALPLLSAAAALFKAESPAFSAALRAPSAAALFS